MCLFKGTLTSWKAKATGSYLINALSSIFPMRTAAELAILDQIKQANIYKQINLFLSSSKLGSLFWFH